MFIFSLHQYLFPSPRALFPGNSCMFTSFTLRIHYKLSSALPCNLPSFCKTCLTHSACVLATTSCTFSSICLSKNNPLRTLARLSSSYFFEFCFHLLHPRALPCCRATSHKAILIMLITLSQLIQLTIIS